MDSVKRAGRLSAPAGGVWTINLGRVVGIPIRLHITLILFLVWIGLESKNQGEQPVSEVLFIVCLFACVLLHEMGHALTARRFGIRTRDIVLYPFGGVASLMGEAGPWAELCITAAGPLVNVIIAALLWPWVSLPDELPQVQDTSLIARIFFANIILVVFNLIPAFPMDGGRILRAVLLLLRVSSATLIAARVSQVLSVILAAFALYTGNVILIFISSIVFMNALQEHVREKARRAAFGFRVKDVMTDLSVLQVLTHGTTISQALPIALKSLQSVFPVVLGDAVIGIVDKNALLREATSDPEDAYVSEIMEREFVKIDPDDKLIAVTEKLDTSSADSMLVVKNGRLVGMLHKEKLLEFLLVHGLRRRMQESDEVEAR